MPAEIVSLLVPGHVLTAKDVATLRAALDAPRWEIRQARLYKRDDAIRAALAALAPLDRTNAARALERAWNRLRCGSAGRTDFDALVREIDRLHGAGSILGVPQIIRITRAGRTPPGC